MRIALIAVGDDPAEPAERCSLAGLSLARHQLEFALALDSRKIVLFGPGASKEAIDLRHAAEAAGAQVQAVRDVRDLPAAVRGDDHLLVLAHGLLPESQLAFGLLQEADGILVLPAEAGWSAGFERLDLTASWGGAMVIPGRLVAHLDQLPEDAEPVAGLLRIARQAGVPERSMPERELAEGRWQIVRSADAVRSSQPAWLLRRLPASSPFRPTRWLTWWLMRRFGASLIGKRGASAGLAGGSVVGLAAAIAAGWFGFASLAFAILLLSMISLEAAEALGRLRRSIFVSETRQSKAFLIFHLMWDAAFTAAGALSIQGSWAHRLFAPLVTTGVLHVSPRQPDTEWRALASDRGLQAAVIAVAAALDATEATFMALALVLIALRIRVAAVERG